MRLSFRLLAAVKDLKKKKKKVGGRTSTVKARSAATDIPEDILVEILVRLPVDSLMRFKCVSKYWFSLISSKYFTDLFFKFSSSSMRVYMYAEQRRGFMENSIPILFSSSLINIDSAACFIKLNHDLKFPGSGIKDSLEFVNALKGLMCFTVNRTILRIINLTTRQVLNVPCVNSNTFSGSHCFEWNYFGYDPVNDEYKLLRTTGTASRALWKGRRGQMRSETQVLVLGAGASWRNTKSLTSPQSYRPWGRGVSIKGVLYWGALSHWNEIALMSFDFSSEEFNLIEFPIEFTRMWMERSVSEVKLMSYQDRVAVIDDFRLNTERILDLWVLEDAGESKWSHKTFVLPYHQLKLSLELDEIQWLRIKGTGRSGEVMLSGGRYMDRNKNSHHALYELEKNHILRGVVLEYPFIKPSLWEDVENIMYLEA